MTQNLILGIIDGYHYGHIARFFESLMNTAYKGHVCVFAGPRTDPQAVCRLERIKVEVIRYNDSFPFIEKPHKDNFKSLPNPIHIYNFRHFLYYNYILEHEQDIENVLLTDIRDVFFQNDPFDFAIGSNLYVAMESRDLSIAEDSFNSKWILNGYGRQVLQEVGDNIISCAGTTIGPLAEMKRYLFKMLMDIQLLKDAYHCADQAVHNVLLNRGSLDPVVRLFNEDSPVLTVATLNSSFFDLDEEGYVLNERKQRVNLIHQYDRHPELKKVVNKIAFKNHLIFRPEVMVPFYYECLYDRMPRVKTRLKRIFGLKS